jgi:hypothetical protein
MLITIYTEKGNSFQIPYAINPLQVYAKLLPEKGTFVDFPQITGADQFTINEAILMLPYVKKYGKNFVSLCAEFIDWSRSDVGEQIIQIGEQFKKITKLVEDNTLVL